MQKIQNFGLNKVKMQVKKNKWALIWFLMKTMATKNKIKTDFCPKIIWCFINKPQHRKIKICEKRSSQAGTQSLWQWSHRRPIKTRLQPSSQWKIKTQRFPDASGGGAGSDTAVVWLVTLNPHQLTFKTDTLLLFYLFIKHKTVL